MQYKAIGVKHSAITEGKIYDLTEDAEGYTFLDDDGDERWTEIKDDNVHCATWHAVSTGPVRTVTRREIVPGVYGRVEVGEKDIAGLAVRFLDRRGKVGTTAPHLMTANELDAAARVLSELAEALRDESGIEIAGYLDAQ